MIGLVVIVAATGLVSAVLVQRQQCTPGGTGAGLLGCRAGDHNSANVSVTVAPAEPTPFTGSQPPSPNSAGTPALSTPSGHSVVPSPEAQGSSASAKPWPTGKPQLPVPTRAGVSLTAFGARCDGHADDTQALVQALAQVPPQGKDIVIPGRTCRVVTAGGGLGIGSGTTVRGESAASVVQLESAGGFAALLHPEGTDITLSNLTLTRRGSFSGVLINLGAVQRLLLANVVLDGKVSVASEEFHGIMISAAQGSTLSQVSMSGCTLKNLTYGMLQPSSVGATTHGWSVDRSTFTGNWADDLEFNAPNALISNVRITNSSFSHNRFSSPTYAAGFAVGLAHVSGARVENNTFTGYQVDAVHIEDRSSDVVVRGNTFARVATSPQFSWAAAVFIVSGSQRIRVQGNLFDLRVNTNRVAGVLADGGGGSPPATVTITGNRFLLSASARPVDVGNTVGLVQTGNTVNRPGSGGANAPEPRPATRR